MGVLLAGFLAYFGVYAGVLLGSLSAEELPVGRYRLRILQLLLLIIVLLLLLYEVIAQQRYSALLLIIGIVITELAFLVEQDAKTFSFHPKEKTLLLYGLLGLIVGLYTAPLGFTYGALVLLFGLVTGSLIAEPYVEDRLIIPWYQPYIVAAKWTWTYPVVIVAVAVFSAVAGM